MIPGLAGALLGLAGSLASKWMDTGANAKAAKAVEDVRLAREQLAYDTEVLRAQASKENAAAAADNTKTVASFEADRDTYASPVINFIRGITRPLITWLFVVMFAYVIVFVVGIGEFAKHAESIIFAMLELTTLVVTWWFGARPVHIRNTEK